MAVFLSPAMKERREGFSPPPEHDETNSKGPFGRLIYSSQKGQLEMDHPYKKLQGEISGWGEVCKDPTTHFPPAQPKECWWQDWLIK